MTLSPIVRPSSLDDVVLKMTINVGSQSTTVDLDGWGESTVDFDGIRDHFERSNLSMREGCYSFLASEDGVLVVEIPGGGDDIETFAETFEDSVLQSHCEQMYNGLIAAYRGMPDEHQLELIVQAAVQQALFVADQIPFNGDFQLPAIEAIQTMVFDGVCVRCHFHEEDSLMAAVIGRRPKLLPNVVQIAGVNFRVTEMDGRLVSLVGYLPHENGFEEVFHNDLVARLQPLLTLEFIRSVIQKYLTMGEVTRRLIVCEGAALMEAYGFTADDVAGFADAAEEVIRDAPRHQRE